MNDIIQYTTAPIFLTLCFSKYFIVIKMLINHMKKRKEPYNINKILYIYNTFQILLNFYIIYGMREFISYTNPFSINKEFTKKIEYYTYIHYLSKYLDYFDTYFIILKCKNEQQLSFLHIYHHSSIGLIWGFLINNGVGNGTAAYGCFINSVIHFIMYGHYLITSLGYKNPFKMYITQLQLLQFACCIIHSFTVLLYENIVPKKYAYLELSYHMSMIFLFNNFYKKSYKKKTLYIDSEGR